MLIKGSVLGSVYCQLRNRSILGIGLQNLHQRRKTYRRGDFVDQVAVNVEENGTVELLVDDMGLEDLIVKGAGGAFC